jgi:hypothetical protein
MPVFVDAPLSFRHVVLATTIAASVALALAACTATPDGTPTAAASSSSTDTGSSPRAETPAPNPEPTMQRYPVGKTCDDLVSLQALYDFNPNFAYDSRRAPESGSEAEKLVSMMGLSCTYVNLSSDNEIVLAVAKLDESGLSSVRASLTAGGALIQGSGTPPALARFFSTSDGVGTLDILTNTYWVSVSSTTFTSPEDTSHFVAAFLPSLS